jgi:hypothetical protein
MNSQENWNCIRSIHINKYSFFSYMHNIQFPCTLLHIVKEQWYRQWYRQWSPDSGRTVWPNRLRARGERESVCSKDHNRWFFAGSFRKVAKYSDPSDGRILLFWRSFGFRSDGVEGGLNSHGMKELYVRPSFFLSVCSSFRPSLRH